MEANRFRTMFSTMSVAVLIALSLLTAGCSNTPSSAAGVGSATVSLSDPPSCKNFDHVYVTIDGVSASTSTSDTGWQQLATQLSSTSGAIKAVQVDLLNLPQNGQCLLAQLGSTQSLPVGDYGQMRLMLVPNNATGVTLLAGSVDPSNNRCSDVNAWNCVVEPNLNDPMHPIITPLSLSSQAQTGEKIPPGQILGGPIRVAAGQSVDINLDFNACRSIVAQGNGQYRLDPTLVAYQVSQNLTGISGQVVQGSIVSNALQVTTTGVSGANVALEMTTPPTDGSNNVDKIGNFLTATDANGNFAFCPLPSGPFDIVTDAGASTATTGNYNATVVTGVPNGSKMTVPILAETGGPATVSGQVTATATDTTATSVTANLYALQAATTSLEFAVPLLTGSQSGSDPLISQLSLTCSGGDCSAPFSLVIPASNPLVGAFSSGNISWTLPTAPTVSYKVAATCSGSSGAVGTFSTPASIVTAGNLTTLSAGQPPQLTGCK
jgi:hypothetical protein